jgi:hypothetical protein
MSTLGSLDQAQNAEDVKRVLNQIKIQYNYIVHGSPGVEVPEDLDPAEVG